MQADYSRDGISRRSTTIFSTPSEYAKRNLFYPEMFGHYWCNTDYRVDRAPLDSYLLLLTLHGSGTVFSGTGKHLCRALEFILVDCNEPHHYHANENWEFCWLHFHGACSRELVRYILESGFDHTPIEQTSLAVHSFMQITRMEGAMTIDTEIMVSALIHQLLSEIIRQAASRQRFTIEATQIAASIAYIEQHYTENISLDRIAQTFSLSKSAFCHKFKQETGFSPYDYILTKRINHAKYLLKTTDQPIGSISYTVGFQSEANFTRHFKKRNGITPSVFRQVRL